MSSERTQEPFSKTEKFYEKYVERLESSFKDSIKILTNDPIMECFKENKESQMFMFDRIKEVIDQSIQIAQDEFNKEALQRLDDMKNFSHSLKDEIKQLHLLNRNLKEKLKKNIFSENQKNGRGEQFNTLQIDKIKMQNMLEETRKEFESMKAKYDDSKNLLKWKDNVIRKLEDRVNDLEKGSNESKHNIENLNFELKEAKNQERKFRSLYNELKATYTREESKICVACEKSNLNIVNERKEIERLKKLNAKLTNSKSNDYKITLNENEDLKKFLKEKERILKDKNQKIEDLEYSIKQLEHSLATFKKELTESTKRVREERKYRHSVEIKMIELKDSFSELSLEVKSVRDEGQKSKQELEYVQNLLQAKESELKAQRRKAATLERELEQSKFSSETSCSALNEKLNCYQEISNSAKMENQNLETKIDKMVLNFQGRIEEERNCHLKTKEELQDSREKTERLETERDNLAKKVQSLKNKVLSFYKSKNIQKVEEKEGNPELKRKIESLQEQIRKLKKSVQKSKFAFLQDQKQLLRSTKDTLFKMKTRMRDLTKKCGFYEKDIQKLKNDISHLESINNSATGSLAHEGNPIKKIIVSDKIKQKYGFQRNEKKQPKNYGNFLQNQKPPTKPSFKNYGYNENLDTSNSFNKRKEYQRRSSTKPKTVFLSPIKRQRDASDDIKKLEISEIEKESMEIERRISKLKQKSRKYSRDFRDTKGDNEASASNMGYVRRSQL